MLARTFLAIVRRSARARRLLFRLFFQFLARWTRNAEWWTCMNYGYAELEDGGVPIPLRGEAGSDRRLGATRRYVPIGRRGIMKTFVGAQGSRIPDFLRDGRMRYLSFVLQKPSVAPTERRNDVAAACFQGAAPLEFNHATESPVGVTARMRRKPGEPALDPNNPGRVSWRRVN